MTPEAIYRALCIVDPALEPWQKCEHEWDCLGESSSGHSVIVPKMHYRCNKCGREEHRGYIGATPFGDGKSRYQTVDELLALCERLSIKLMLEMPDTWAAEDGRVWRVRQWHGGLPRLCAQGKTAVEALQYALICPKTNFHWGDSK